MAHLGGEDTRLVSLLRLLWCDLLCSVWTADLILQRPEALPVRGRDMNTKDFTSTFKIEHLIATIFINRLIMKFGD